MKAVSLLTGLLSLAVFSSPAVGDDPEAAASARIKELQQQYQEYIRDTLETRETGCTSKNLLRRREWGSLSHSERQSYIAAVYCLYNNPNFVTDPSTIPGVRNRYDDFVGGHILLTPYVHASGFFLPFHRLYVHLYEKALRDECGYAGAQPYWDWTLSYEDPRNASVFDGSPWSMGSNGVYVPDREPITVSAPGFSKTIPPATGGGCIESGPFTADKFSMDLGPVGLTPTGPDGGLGYNPRCVARDLSPDLASSCTRPSNVTAVLDGCGDLACFNTLLDDPYAGVHANGHYQVGGIQLDVYTSPADPIFWLHHAQIDRLWTIWQNLVDPQNRTFQVWGTQTSGNVPPSDDVTLDTPVPSSAANPATPIRELVSTIDGPFCYIYE